MQTQQPVDNYMTKIVAMQDAGALPRVGVAEIAYHDDWCALLAQSGPCNCDPDVRLKWEHSAAAQN